jgi:putative methionine-R-sulfoxide reductase with GAF domain
MERLSSADIASRVASSQLLLLDIAAIAAAVPLHLSAADASSLGQYRVPEVRDGACSAPDRLQAEPFNIQAALEAAGGSCGLPVLRRLYALRGVCARLAAACDAQWAGVYLRTRPAGSDEEALLKLAYVGAPSRALFPLTPQFAALSNNSTVGLTGEAVVIADVQALPSDSPYYSCDGRVRSEICAPICDCFGNVLGVVDVEAFAPGTFTPERVDLVLHCCAQLAETKLLASYFQ